MKVKPSVIPSMTSRTPITMKAMRNHHALVRFTLPPSVGRPFYHLGLQGLSGKRSRRSGWSTCARFCTARMNRAVSEPVKRLISFALALAIALGTASPASAAIRVVDRARARGDIAVASANGNVDEPRRLWVKVKAQPNQGVQVAWSLDCSQGNRDEFMDGDFVATTPATRKVRMPLARP